MDQLEEQRDHNDLRHRAEALLEDSEPAIEDLSPAEVGRLLQELRIHQIELELQNQELRQAQVERELLLEQYTDLYDSAPIGYFILDASGVIRRANLTGATLLSQKRERLVGQRLSRYVASADQENYHFYLVRLFQHEGLERCQVRLKPLKAPSFHAHLEGQVLRENLLRNRLCRVMVSDISQRVRAQRALQQARDELERQIKERTAELEHSNQELEQFARVVSHDLQEPLRTVKSYLELVQRHHQDQLDAETDEFISYAVDGATRMQEMIQALLNLARVQSRGGEFAPVNCRALLEWTLADLSLAIQETGAQVTHNLLPTVLADEAQLAQVFQNLIGNALKFHGEEPPRVHVSAWRAGDEWRFSVKDNGIGIDPAQTERIFEMFQRLHTRDEYEGTGIGLTICKKIVGRHGGRIWVESEPGQGSTFYFTLPAEAS